MMESTQLIFDALSKASCQNPDLLKQGEELLATWECHEGFYSGLMNIISNVSLDLNVRWLAVLYFKNGIDRYWRHTAPNSIRDRERRNLKNQLLSHMKEPVNQIALQLAVLISKIARIDLPTDWPELLPSLLDAMKSSDVLLQDRSLLVFQHTIKMLSSKRLPKDKKYFEELTNNIFPIIMSYWNLCSNDLLKQVSECNPDYARSLNNGLMCLKVLRKLISFGIKDSEYSNDLYVFVNLMLERLPTFLECRKSVADNPRDKELFDKFIVQLLKILLSLLAYQPFFLVPYLPKILQLTCYYGFTPEAQSLVYEKFTILCFNLIKSILLCQRYKGPSNSEEVKSPSVEAEATINSFFTVDTLNVMTRRLIEHYFVMTPEELHQWDTDPEEFCISEGGDSWKYSLRPCTESFFLAIMKKFRPVLCPIILEFIRSLDGEVKTNDKLYILRKDAIYLAAGLSAFDLFDDLNFDSWFTNVLINELKIKDRDYIVIRRRVVWLIGTWSAVRFSPELRPQLYECLLNLLDRTEDFVIRFTSAMTLRTAVDDNDFSSDQFLPFLPSCFDLLFYLLKEVKECDLKMNVLHVLSVVIVRMQSYFRPFCSSLLEYLPLLWSESREHGLLQCAIVNTLEVIVKGLGSTTEDLLSFLVPVLIISTDMNSDSHVYLMQDGLLLWLTILENVAEPKPSLLKLFSNLFPILETTAEIQVCVRIVEAYILLCPKLFLEAYGQQLVSILLDHLNDLRPDGVALLLELVEMSMIASLEPSLSLFRPILERAVWSIYEEDVSAIAVLRFQFSLISRVILQAPTVFQEFIHGLSLKTNKQPDEVLKKILEFYLERKSSVNALERSKLIALSLGSLLTTQSSVIYDLFCGILLVIVEVLNDLVSTDDLGAQTDCLILEDSSDPYDYFDRDSDEADVESEHYKRLKQVSEKDLVHQVVLKDYVQSQLNNLHSIIGPSNFEQLLSTVDVETLHQAKTYFHLGI